MKTWNENKKIKIEIYAPSHPADGYTIWDVSGANKHAITRKADEDQIFNILSENDYRQFENNGKYKFTVTAGALSAQFEYLYY